VLPDKFWSNSDRELLYRMSLKISKSVHAFVDDATIDSQQRATGDKSFLVEILQNLLVLPLSAAHRASIVFL
jgi:hypothetical protein